VRPRHIVGYILVAALALGFITFISDLVGDGYK